MQRSPNLHLVLFGFIDETETILRALKQDSSYYISQCSGLESFERILIENCDFDIVVLQLSYREKNIDEILNFIAKKKDLPVLIITNSKVRKHAYEAFALGIEDYMHVSEINPPSLKRSIDFAIKRKDYKQQISRSQDNYKTLFYSSPLPMWVSDRYTLSFLSVNQAAIKYYGYSEDEFLKMKVSDLWIKEEKEKIKLKAKKFINEFLHDTVYHIKKNRSIIRVNFYTTPINYDGREAHLTIAEDITKNLRIKKKLKISKERFKSLVQEGSDLIAILDENLCYKYVSPSSESILSLKSNDLLKQKFINNVHPEDKSYIETLLKGNKNNPGNKLSLPFFRFKDGMGYWRFIETKVTNLIDYAPVEGIVINSRDVTDLVEQRNRLSESLSRYEIVSEATSDIITDFNIEKGEVKISKALYKVCGYDPRKIEKENFQKWLFENIHEEDRYIVKEKIMKALESGTKSFQLEYRFRCANGSYKTILDRSYVVTDKNGKPQRIIGSKQDVTQQKEYLKQLESRNRRLEEIAWEQSHMVRAPLAKIMGLVDLIKHSKKNGADLEDLLEKILNSAKDLDDIVRKITKKTYN